MDVHLQPFYHFYGINELLIVKYRLNTTILANQNIFVSMKLDYESHLIIHMENSQIIPKFI